MKRAELVGMKWGQLSEGLKEQLLYGATAIDAVTGCNKRDSGECTVDLIENLSVPGQLICSEFEDVIIVEDEAIIYESYELEEDTNMTREDVLNNLKELAGQEMSESDLAEEIIIAFGDFEEEGKTEVYVGDSHNSGYDWIAYINAKDSTQFLFNIDKRLDEYGDKLCTITDVWIA